MWINIDIEGIKKKKKETNVYCGKKGKRCRGKNDVGKKGKYEDENILRENGEKVRKIILL